MEKPNTRLISAATASIRSGLNLPMGEMMMLLSGFKVQGSGFRGLGLPTSLLELRRDKSPFGLRLHKQDSEFNGSRVQGSAPPPSKTRGGLIDKRN